MGTQLDLDEAFWFDGKVEAKQIGSPSSAVAYLPDQPWLEVVFRTSTNSWTARVATDDPHGEALLTTVRTTPNPSVICAIASGTAYAVDVTDFTGQSWV